MPTWKPILSGAFIVALPVLGWFSITAAIFAVVALLLVAFASKADQVVEFAFGPLKAKLERNISRSEKLVQSLRALAVLQAKLAVSTISRTGRWADSGEWTYQGVRELEEALKEIGVSETELADVRSDFVRFTLIDFGSAILGGNTIPSKLGDQAVEEWKTIRRNGDWTNPDALEAWLDKWGAKSEAHQRLLSDMRQIIADDDLASQEQFMRKENDIEPIRLASG